jgi:hypothetical protein
MARLRIADIAASTSSASRLRVADISAAGAAAAASRLRVADISATGAFSVVVAPIPLRQVEPETVVSTTAALVGGGSATWVWRQISGPSVSLVASGPTCTFVSPSLFFPGDLNVVLLGVIATVSGVASTELEILIDVLSQTKWVRPPDGGGWRGRVPQWRT